MILKIKKLINDCQHFYDFQYVTACTIVTIVYIIWTNTHTIVSCASCVHKWTNKQSNNQRKNNRSIRILQDVCFESVLPYCRLSLYHLFLYMLIRSNRVAMCAYVMNDVNDYEQWGRLYVPQNLDHHWNNNCLILNITAVIGIYCICTHTYHTSTIINYCIVRLLYVYTTVHIHIYYIFIYMLYTRMYNLHDLHSECNRTSIIKNKCQISFQSPIICLWEWIPKIYFAYHIFQFNRFGGFKFFNRLMLYTISRLESIILFTVMVGKRICAICKLDANLSPNTFFKLPDDDIRYHKFICEWFFKWLSQLVIF